VAALLACRAGTSPETEVLAVIESEYQPVMVVVPEQVTAGVAFEVAVTTLHELGCAEEGRTDIVVVGATAIITPYTVIPSPPPKFCPSAIAGRIRRGSVTFVMLGPAIVKVRGRSVIGPEREIEVDYDVRVIEE
jgi:hypothetical protein